MANQEARKDETLARVPHRCLICGRFFSSPLPDAFACNGHVFDWQALPERERVFRIGQSIYRPTAALGAAKED